MLFVEHDVVGVEFDHLLQGEDHEVGVVGVGEEFGEVDLGGLDGADVPG